MLFNSYEFIFLFLPITLFTFFFLGQKRKHQLALIFLVIASLFFYAWWNLNYLILLLLSIGFNYSLGVVLGRQDDGQVNRKLLLAFGVAVNLILLGYYKYANFFLDSFNFITGTNWTIAKIVFPLGISFFTFQQIAYLVDVYRGTDRENNILNYALFVSFFPYLISGPIVRYQQVIPQFIQSQSHRFNSENMAVGITIFVMGLFKKVIFADRIGNYVTPVFEAAAQNISPNFSEAWLAALAYTLQLYFDFSGYSDMAIGIGRMFSIKLPLNFNSPYKASSISDFWRRWHITLSNFLRDYIYIPLGGNRRGELRRYTNLMITMLLGGLWHGAGWTFVLWGALHGFYLVVHRLWQRLSNALGQDWDKSLIGKGLAWLVTFLAVVVSWVFFRASNLQSGWLILEAMLGFNGIFLAVKSLQQLAWILGLLLIALLTPNVQEWMAQYKPCFDSEILSHSQFSKFKWWEKLQWQPTLLWSVISSVLMIISVTSLLKKSEFLYFQF